MKIGFSSLVLEGGKSGISTYVNSLITEMQRIDHENAYDLYCLSSEENQLSIQSENFTKCFGSNVLRNPLCSILWHNTIFPVRAYQNKYDIIHVPTIRRIPFFKPCKLVVTVHDLSPFILKHKYDPIRTFYHKKILSKLIHRCDHIITVSENTKRDLVDLLFVPEQKISVTYLGVDEQTFHPITEERAKTYLEQEYGVNKPFFVYVSRLEHPAKNHLMLMRAFELFNRKVKGNHQLIFVGADWQGSEIIRENAALLECYQDIKFVGYVPTEDLSIFYSACELMVYPSLYEGFGLPVVEAMACGAPVICSNNSSLQEIANDCALTFDPKKEEEICQSMIEAIQPGQRSLLSEKGKKHAKNFSWEKNARQVLKIYEKVVG